MSPPLKAHNSDNINYYDEDYFLPLEDQRVFGAGIKRKRVPFVRPTSENSVLKSTPDTNSEGTSSTRRSRGIRIADHYLSMVLSNKKNIPVEEPPSRLLNAAVSDVTLLTTSPLDDRDAATSICSAQSLAESLPMCQICNLPISNSNTGIAARSEEGDNKARRPHISAPHEASLVHQVCLSHSYPPSHLDRTRHGMRYLSSYGWDPDSRLGLGATGREGIREPVRTRPKNDTVGLGMNLDRSGSDDENDERNENDVKVSEKSKERKRKAQASMRKKLATTTSQIPRLDAKRTRLAELADRRRREKMQEMFYRSDDILRYLGETN